MNIEFEITFKHKKFYIWFESDVWYQHINNDEPITINSILRKWNYRRLYDIKEKNEKDTDMANDIYFDIKRIINDQEYSVNYSIPNEKLFDFLCLLDEYGYKIKM